MVKWNCLHERANPLVPARGRFCRVTELCTCCQKSSSLFPHSMVACAIRWLCFWLSQGSCANAWLPAASSLTFLCLALRDTSPCIALPPAIQSFSCCSKHSFTQKCQPLPGPGSSMNPSCRCCCLSHFSSCSVFPTWLLAPFPVSSCWGTGRTCYLSTPTTAFCHLKQQTLSHERLMVEAIGIWASCGGTTGRGYGGRRFGFKCRVSSCRLT